MLRSSLRLNRVLLAAAVLSLGCASGPTIISSTADNVAIEFPADSSVSSASALAHEECARVGKVADFDAVDKVASPKTRVAKFRCVSPNGASSANPGSN